MYHLAEIINFAWEMDTGKEKDFSFMGAQFSHDLWLAGSFQTRWDENDANYCLCNILKILCFENYRQLACKHPVPIFCLLLLHYRYH